MYDILVNNIGTFFIRFFFACLFFSFITLHRRYIPELKDYPNRYIYEPWNTPESIQKAANCVVGVDYPRPMLNHAESSRLNIERMKQVYQQLSHYRGLSESHHKSFILIFVQCQVLLQHTNAPFKSFWVVFLSDVDPENL